MEQKNEAVAWTRFSCKTGEYIGETVQREERRALVKTLAVLRHPAQGDLHRPYEPDAAMFHERRALAYTEKVWVPLQDMEIWEGHVPDYRQSLEAAWNGELERVDRLKRWAEQCIVRLESVGSDYGF